MTSLTSGTASGTEGQGLSDGPAPLPLPWLLRRVNQRYRAEIAGRLAAAQLGDLPQPGTWALMAIARGEAEPNQLMARMGVSKQAISKLVDRLVASDFVERTPNRTDRRRTDLTLTDKGREAVRVMTTAVGATEEAIVTEVGADSFADLTRMLAQLAGEES
jgi:DNA-binding MarR family transcriptional regulator